MALLLSAVQFVPRFFWGYCFGGLSAETVRREGYDTSPSESQPVSGYFLCLLFQEKQTVSVFPKNRTF